MYNLTNITDANTYFEVIQGANSITHDGFSIFFLFAFFIVCLMVFSEYELKRTFLGISFVTSMIGGLLYFADLGSFKIVIIPMILMVVSAFILLMEE